MGALSLIVGAVACVPAALALALRGRIPLGECIHAQEQAHPVTHGICLCPAVSLSVVSQPHPKTVRQTLINESCFFLSLCLPGVQP